MDCWSEGGCNRAPPCIGLCRNTPKPALDELARLRGEKSVLSDLSASDEVMRRKIDANVWDHIDDVLPIIEAARAGRWQWFSNSKCKYIELRIDMRDGGCIVKDRDGNRISVDSLAHQHAHRDGQPWPDKRPDLADWQRKVMEGPN